MTFNKKLYLFLFLILTFSSCDFKQSKIDSVAAELDYAEANKKEMATEDWVSLQTKVEELEQDLDLKRDNYSDEQVKQIRKLQGRYAALAFKKGLNDFQDSMKDLGDQVEGFVDEMQKDTIN
jgi:hypothetical protein